ncbi:MAG: hypothetical protein KGR26_06100 [Cyanobacteria bacterium REEB65]|nr:hypothetical protein [Cyanobacteria bacterium REEB65]
MGRISIVLTLLCGLQCGCSGPRTLVGQGEVVSQAVAQGTLKGYPATNPLSSAADATALAQKLVAPGGKVVSLTRLQLSALRTQIGYIPPSLDPTHYCYEVILSISGPSDLTSEFRNEIYQTGPGGEKTAIAPFSKIQVVLTEDEGALIDMQTLPG